MKSKEQVIRYTSRRRFSDDDWLKVLSYCHDLYGSGVRKSQRPKSEQTYEGFLDWMENGIADGEVVDVNGDVGLFCDNGDGTYKLLAIQVKNKIVKKESQINIADVKVVDGTEFYQKMRKSGLQYSVTHAAVFDRKLPTPYTRVSYQTSAGNGVGILCKCVHQYAEFLWCYDIEERLDYKIPLTDIDFLTFTKDDVRKLDDLMGKCGAVFNRRTMKIDKAPIRNPEGENYWYLTDFFTLKRDIDNRDRRDDERYKCGNYFTTYEEIFDFYQKIVKIRKGLG